MANQIARGTTGQATFDQIHADSPSPSCPFYWSVSGIPNTYDNTNPGGWNVTRDGTITVPLNAPLGLTFARYAPGEPYNETDPSQGCKVYEYSFEVVCMTTQISVTKTLTTGLGNGQYKHDYTATTANQGGTGPFTYVWQVPGLIDGQGTVTVHFSVTNSDAGGAGWGTAKVNVTDAAGCTATASQNVATTGGGSGSGTGTNAPSGPGNGACSCLGCPCP